MRRCPALRRAASRRADSGAGLRGWMAATGWAPILGRARSPSLKKPRAPGSVWAPLSQAGSFTIVRLLKRSGRRSTARPCGAGTAPRGCGR